MFDFFKGTVTPKDWAFVGAILGVTVVICAAFYFLVYAKQQQKLSALEAEVSQIRARLNDARNTERNFDQLQAQSRKMDELVKLFNDRLPDQREIPKLIRMFEGLGDSVGVQPQLTPLPTLTDATKETIPYQVTARGTFHQIVSFINLLERDKRYLKISELDIGPEDAGVSEAKFILSTFRFIQTAASEAK